MKSTLCAEKKIAQLGALEACFEKKLELNCDDYLRLYDHSGHKLSHLLFDPLGSTHTARIAATKLLALNQEKPEILKVIECPGVFRLLKDPIFIHPTLLYLIQEDRNVQRASIETLFNLPKRTDLLFYPLPALLNLLLEVLCNGFLQLGNTKISLQELPFKSVQNLFTYILDLHDANFGKSPKNAFIESLIEHCTRTFPHIPQIFLQQFATSVRTNLLLEVSKPGSAHYFLMMNQHHLNLSNVNHLQRALAVLAKQTGKSNECELLPPYLTSDAFADYLYVYASISNPNIKRDEFCLPYEEESSPETVAESMYLDMEFRDFQVHDIPNFLFKLNQLVWSNSVQRLLFVGKFCFLKEEAPLFSLPPRSFLQALRRSLWAATEKIRSEQIYLSKECLQKIFPEKEVYTAQNGSSYEIARHFTSTMEETLSKMRLIEQMTGYPLSIPIGRLKDGSRLICQMNLSNQKLEFKELSEEELTLVDFSTFRSMRVGYIPP